jgi:hypothetical protein
MYTLTNMSSLAIVLSIATIVLIGFWLFWLFGAMRSSQARKPIDNLGSDNSRFHRQSKEFLEMKDQDKK